MISNIVQTYDVTLVALIFVLALIFYKTEYSLGSKMQIRFFRGILISFLISYFFTIMNTLVPLFTKPIQKFFTRFFLIGIYAFAGCGLYEWMAFVGSTTKLKFLDSLWWKIVSFLPIVVIVVLLLTPLGDDVMHLNDKGYYEYGLSAYYIIAIELLYQIAAIAISVAGRKSLRVKSEKRMQRKLYFSILCLGIGILLNIPFPFAPTYELSLIPGVIMIFTELVSSQLYTDALTGLSNRRRIEEYLDSSLKEASENNSVELFLFDLDYFKSINDILGHKEGDTALKVFAEALRHTPDLRGTWLARYGGDEFIAVSVKGLRDPKLFYERLTKNLTLYEKEHGLKYHINFSMGYAVATYPGLTSSELFKRADEDMYRIKTDHHEKLKDFEDELRKAGHR